MGRTNEFFPNTGGKSRATRAGGLCDLFFGLMSPKQARHQVQLVIAQPQKYILAVVRQAQSWSP
jgi:hypothetical protein